eukprot:3748614-Prymnesium_polylepis.1
MHSTTAHPDSVTTPVLLQVRLDAGHEKKITSDGSRTRNLPIRSRMPYPLGHGGRCIMKYLGKQK